MTKLSILVAFCVALFASFVYGATKDQKSDAYKKVMQVSTSNKRETDAKNMWGDFLKRYSLKTRTSKPDHRGPGKKAPKNTPPIAIPISSKNLWEAYLQKKTAKDEARGRMTNVQNLWSKFLAKYVNKNAATKPSTAPSTAATTKATTATNTAISGQELTQNMLQAIINNQRRILRVLNRLENQQPGPLLNRLPVTASISPSPVAVVAEEAPATETESQEAEETSEESTTEESTQEAASEEEESTENSENNENKGEDEVNSSSGIGNTTPKKKKKDGDKKGKKGKKGSKAGKVVKDAAKGAAKKGKEEAMKKIKKGTKGKKKSTDKKDDSQTPKKVGDKKRKPSASPKPSASVKPSRKPKPSASASAEPSSKPIISVVVPQKPAAQTKPKELQEIEQDIAIVNKMIPQPSFAPMKVAEPYGLVQTCPKKTEAIKHLLNVKLRSYKPGDLVDTPCGKVIFLGMATDDEHPVRIYLLKAPRSHKILMLIKHLHVPNWSEFLGEPEFDLRKDDDSDEDVAISVFNDHEDDDSEDKMEDTVHLPYFPKFAYEGDERLDHILHSQDQRPFLVIYRVLESVNNRLGQMMCGDKKSSCPDEIVVAGKNMAGLAAAHTAVLFADILLPKHEGKHLSLYVYNTNEQTFHIPIDEDFVTQRE